MTRLILQIYHNFIIVLPIFIVIGIGYVLKKKAFFNELLVDKITKLVFWGCLPIMLFQKIADSDFSQNLDFKVIGICYANLLIFFVFSLAVGKILGLSGGTLGAFAQGAFRANAAIVGLSVIVSAFPENADRIMAKAGIFMAFYVPPLNVLAVMALLIPMRQSSHTREWCKTGFQILMNPLIIGCLAGMIFSVFHLKLPLSLDQTLDLFSGMALPLALLSLGGGMSLTRLIGHWRVLTAANFIKLILMPLGAMGVLVGFGVSGDNLAAVMVLLAAPTAIASYPMARAMGADAELTTNIIMSTTIFSILTYPLWLTLWRWMI